MKLRLSSAICLLGLTTTAFANHAPITSATIANPGKIYIGVFGGYGASNKFNAKQFGTAFYTEAEGGPLAVNAFGSLNSESAGFFGAQLGFQAPDVLPYPCSPWSLGPAVEFEGYTMGNKTFNADLMNDTTRLPEHDFSVSYPMSRNVYLVNGVVNFNHPCLLVHPYIGVGIGSAVLRISGADATQISPPEVGVNHYNQSDSDSMSTFAGQLKLGLSYDVNQYVSVFADYRWLYLAGTKFTFGSTVAPGHVATSSWQVNLDAQRYNMGNIGIRVNL